MECGRTVWQFIWQLLSSSDAPVNIMLVGCSLAFCFSVLYPQHSAQFFLWSYSVYTYWYMWCWGDLVPMDFLYIKRSGVLSLNLLDPNCPLRISVLTVFSAVWSGIISPGIYFHSLSLVGAASAETFMAFSVPFFVLLPCTNIYSNADLYNGWLLGKVTGS